MTASRLCQTLVVLSVIAMTALAAGCSGDEKEASKPLTQPPYTVTSIQSGFVRAGDLGPKAVEYADDGHPSHVVYTPADSIPTCPYVQRSETVSVKVEPAIQLAGGNTTNRHFVESRDPSVSTQPVITQGGLVFESDPLAQQGMKQVKAEAAKCPANFDVLGGPPVIVGEYRISQRAVDVAGWSGFVQRLAHTPPTDMPSDAYDDLATAVLRKSNSIIYISYQQTQKVGDQASSESRLRAMLDQTLPRLG